MISAEYKRDARRAQHSVCARGFLPARLPTCHLIRHCLRAAISRVGARHCAEGVPRFRFGCGRGHTVRLRRADAAAAGRVDRACADVCAAFSDTDSLLVELSFSLARYRRRAIFGLTGRLSLTHPHAPIEPRRRSTAVWLQARHFASAFEAVATVSTRAMTFFRTALFWICRNAVMSRNPSLSSGTSNCSATVTSMPASPDAEKK